MTDTKESKTDESDSGETQDLGDITQLLSLTKEEGSKRAKLSGLKFRVNSEDGVAFMGTCDYRMDRINVDIVKGVIVSAHLG